MFLFPSRIHLLTLPFMLAAFIKPACGFDIQQMINEQPGQVIQLPPGDHLINSAIVIEHDGGGLRGPGRIIQQNDDEPIIKLSGANNLSLTALTVMRRAPIEKNCKTAIWVEGCRDATLDSIQVLDNPCSFAAIRVDQSTNTTIRDSLIRNFKCITIDDRTEKELDGYAFRAIDGTGIRLHATNGTAIVNNRIEETRLEPTKATRDRYGLGDVTVMPKVPGLLMEKSILEKGYTSNWHQGAGVLTTKANQRTLISGNLIRHAPQGLDLHCDQAVVTNNIIDEAMIGMKAMHGARNMLVSGNQFLHCDLWGLLLMPGATSHKGGPAKGQTEPRAPNTDGGHVAANNIFNGFGYGSQYWNWKDRQPEYPELNVIAVLFGQLPEIPPIRNVLITGNLVETAEQESTTNSPGGAEARYHHALYVEKQREPLPVNVMVESNLLMPGLKGTTN